MSYDAYLVCKTCKKYSAKTKIRSWQNLCNAEFILMFMLYHKMECHTNDDGFLILGDDQLQSYEEEVFNAEEFAERAELYNHRAECDG
jgi:hypothetical protein